MHNIELILTLAAGFSAALVLGYLTHRLGLSPIVGYLLAGIIVGPQTPGFVADRHLAEQLAEVGVILLMFGVGLHFHLKDLLAVKNIAILGAIVQSTVATVLAAVTAHAFGWSWPAGIVFGLALSVASTVVLVRVLSDFGMLHSSTGRVAIGWLVMEDIFTVFVLVLLPVVFGSSDADLRTLSIALVVATVKLAAFAAFMLVLGPRVLPKLMNRIAETRSRELFTLAVLAIALGIAAGSSYFFHISMALGAFLAGMVVGQSDFSARAAAEALPMRDAFAVMFFLSVGMLFDPTRALNSPGLIAATLGVIILGKPLAALLITTLLGYGPKVGMGVAVALAQIGEFSFLLANLGTQIGVLPEEAMNPIVAGAIVSITLNPLLYGAIPQINRFLENQSWFSQLLTARAPKAIEGVNNDAVSPTAAHRAIVVGYGPIGQTVVRLLMDRGIAPTVIEMNIETVRRLQQEGIHAVYGDVNQHEIREKAGIDEAASLILSASGSAGSIEAIRGAREANPHVHIVVRADFLREADSLRRAGAGEIFSGEGEVALAMTNSILRELGGTPEQLDEFRDQLRSRLLQGAKA